MTREPKAPPSRVRKRFTIAGAVQGVGFRPFVYRLARQFSLAGHVENNPHGVTIEVEGEAPQVAAFLDQLRRAPPPLARIAEVVVESLTPSASAPASFTIAPSSSEGERLAWISPDTCVCADCLAELFDPSDRRYRYPFINCTNCGPRYTIITDIPYDRPNTTMRRFQMCDDCRREYDDPGDRRFHAQPNACPICGPQVVLTDQFGREMASGWDAICAAARSLSEGLVVAVKGLGGFHLAADAASEQAVGRLRLRKHREEKPLAVMARDLDEARRIALVDDMAEELLTSIQRPIVLLPKNHPDTLAPAVAPAGRCHGVMLPYTPLHHLLLDRSSGGPAALVMTSGNVSDEPIVTDNDEAVRRLKDIADLFLMHDRDIHIRADDSVATVVSGREMLLRRSRGYAPEPIRLAMPPEAAAVEVLAVGPELKNAICLTRGDTAIMSQHVGDIKNMESYSSLEKTAEHLERIMQVKIGAIAHDMHPQYMSSGYARERSERDSLPLIPVQHHHAHFVTAVADSGRDVPSGRGIGAIFDGTGYGPDGTIWGGEFLIADLLDFERIAHLECVPMPGGDAAIEQPWRIALSYLTTAYGSRAELMRALAALRKATGREMVPDANVTVETILRMIEGGVNSPLTSSMGRFFDAVSAITGVCAEATYEGQPAMELEGAIKEGSLESYPFVLDRGTRPWRIRTAGIIRGVVDDLERSVPLEWIAARFHNTIIEITVETCKQIRETEKLNAVALSGGCFQNRYLVEHIEPRLEEDGFDLFTHKHVPPNDGGVALGQAIVAKHRIAAAIREGRPLRQKPRAN